MPQFVVVWCGFSVEELRLQFCVLSSHEVHPHGAGEGTKSVENIMQPCGTIE